MLENVYTLSTLQKFQIAKALETVLRIQKGKTPFQPE